MQVAPSRYWRYAAQKPNPALRCARVQRDDVLSVDMKRVWQANMQVYGADKVCREPRSEGTDAARCTVKRLMRKAGLRGVMRGKVVHTMVHDAKAPCPLDRVNRQFKAQRPNQLWVGDFTYISTWGQKPASSLLWAAKATAMTPPPAETINGAYKTELIHRRAPWKTREAVELTTLEWVSWFNHHRMLDSL